MKRTHKGSARSSLLLSLAWKTLLALGFANVVLGSPDAHAVVTPDNVSPADVVDTENDRPYLVGVAIRNEAGNAGGTCSGLLINPRTVLFAAHCVDGLDPHAYDGNAPGNRAQVGYTTDPVFGRTNLRNWLFGQDFGVGVGGTVPAGDGRVMTDSVMVWYDPRSRFGPLTDPNGFAFLPADIAIAGFDTPTELLGRDAENGIGLMFSRVNRLVPVVIGGYGQAGNGLTGARLALTEDTFFRRVATNMLGFLGSERDLYGGTEPPNIADLFNPPGFNYQDLYWLDFDDPQNRPFDADLNTANPGVTTTFDFNAIRDEATANEAITAAGDSGSPLITNAFGRPVSLGVLSQGSRFFHDVLNFPDDNFVFFPNFSDFGTVAGYNPLFLFWDQIVINNPYKYVQARSGNREWTNPSTWVQEVDPLYYTLAQNGRLQNGVPTSPALGSSDAAPNLGVMNPNPAPIAECAWLETCAPTGGGSGPTGSLAAPRSEEMMGSESVGGGHFGFFGRSGRHGGASGVKPRPSPGTGTADWLTGGLLTLNSGPLTGPGSTNFVPNNTNGTAGLQNSTRWFEVNLRNHGTLSLTNATVEIDRLNIRGVGANLNIRSNARLNTTISSYLDVGSLNVDGVFNPSAFTVSFGVVSGRGTIIAPGGFGNVAGVISPGGLSTGTLTIDGDYEQSGFGTVLFQIGRHAQDLLRVTGDVDMRGNLLVDSDRRLSFGDRFTVVQAGGDISGNFDRTFGSGTLLFGRTVVNSDSIDLIIDAKKLFGFFGHGHQYGSLANALDYARGWGHYAALGDVFNLIDNVSLDSLEFVLPQLTPINAWSEMPMAISYAQGFTRDLAGRTAELRAGVRGMSQQSMLAGYRILGDAAEPNDDPFAPDSGLTPGQGRPIDMGERLGVFIAGQGDISDIGGEAYEGGRYDPSSLAQHSQASMTVGVDYRVNEGFALGVATTMSRYLANSGDYTPLDQTGYGALVYATAWDGAWHLDSYVGIARQDFQTARMIVGDVMPNTVDAEPGAVQTLAGLRGGYTFEPMNGLRIGPVVSLNYSRLALDSYREQGGGDFDLIIDSRRLTSLTAETALEFSYQPINHGRASPFSAFGRFGLVNEVGDGSDVVRARFAAAPDVAFDMTRDLDRQWMNAAAGMSYSFSRDTSASIEASSDVDRDDLSTSTFRFSLQHRF